MGESFEIDDRFIATFRRIVNKIDGVRGSAVTANLPDLLVLDAPIFNPPGFDAPDPLSFLKLTAAWSRLTPNLLTGNPCGPTGTNPATNTINIAILCPATSTAGSYPYDLPVNTVVGYFPMSPTNTQGSSTIVGFMSPAVIPNGAEFYVGVATNSGSFGDSSNRATLLYNVTPLFGGGTIGAALTPETSPARIVACTVTAGGKGSAYFSGTNVLLRIVNELADSEKCS